MSGAVHPLSAIAFAVMLSALLGFLHGWTGGVPKVLEVPVDALVTLSLVLLVGFGAARGAAWVPSVSAIVVPFACFWMSSQWAPRGQHWRFLRNRKRAYEEHQKAMAEHEARVRLALEELRARIARGEEPPLSEQAKRMLEAIESANQCPAPFNCEPLRVGSFPPGQIPPNP